jgi:hypothetical protein
MRARAAVQVHAEQVSRDHLEIRVSPANLGPFQAQVTARIPADKDEGLLEKAAPAWPRLAGALDDQLQASSQATGLSKRFCRLLTHGVSRVRALPR